MILFIAPYPDELSERDGMAQRILAVDRAFERTERVYVDFSLKKNFIPRVERQGQLTVLRSHLLLAPLLVLYFLRRARMVYVHSAYCALKGLFAYFSRRVVTDLHGAVPEELLAQGYPRLSRLYGVVESICVRRSRTLVMVTDAMGCHIRRKYDMPHLAYSVIPIFDEASSDVDAAKFRDADQRVRVVYAGGTQAWQNVELMLNALSEAAVPFHADILSGDLDGFRREIERRPGLASKLQLQSVPKEQVADYYRSAHLGFVLRDRNTVNQVACPTKLIEYIGWGVVPVVKEPEIGDFGASGYRYVRVEDFIAGRIPAGAELEEMARVNLGILQKLQEAARSELAQLVAMA